MKNVDVGKDYVQNMWEVMGKSLVPKLKNLMTICSLFEAQPSASLYNIPKNIKTFIYSNK